MRCALRVVIGCLPAPVRLCAQVPVAVSLQSVAPSRLDVMRNMRVAIVALVALSACRSAPVRHGPVTSLEPGAPTARAAVNIYMQGMHDVDFDALASIWGTRDELARERYSRSEFEKRVFITSCYLGWPGYRIVSEKPAVGGGTTEVVRSTGRGNEQQSALRLEQNSSGRWFVAGADLSGVSPRNCG
jgi:hypothetical protein